MGFSAERVTIEGVSSGAAAVVTEAWYVDLLYLSVTFMNFSLSLLGVLETSRLDLSSVETNSAAEFLSMSTAPPAEHDSASPEPQLAGGNPKLGLAPLSSEMVGPSSGPEAGPSGEAEV